MEIDWCICGKRVFDSNSFYCSKECASDENSKPINSTLSPPQTPPLNLHFSITITSNLYKASNAKAKVLSPPSSGDSSYSDSDLLSSSFASLDRDFNDYVYNYRNHGKEDIVDDDCYPSYYSTSNPIDIPVSRNQAQMKSEGTVDSINKGTFGDNSPFMP